MSDNDELRNEREDSHELLCAFVLGELEDDDRQRVERALVGSKELRAERERIEATIGLVRGAYSGAQALPPEVIVSLENTEPAARPTWHASPNLRAAAALLVIVGGAAFALRALDVGGRGSADDDRLALGGVPTQPPSATGPIELDGVFVETLEGARMSLERQSSSSEGSSSSSQPQVTRAPADGSGGLGIEPHVASNGPAHGGPSDGIPPQSDASVVQVEAGLQASTLGRPFAGGALAGITDETSVGAVINRGSTLSNEEADARARQQHVYTGPPVPPGGAGGGSAGVKDSLLALDVSKERMVSGSVEFFQRGLPRREAASTDLQGNLNVLGKASPRTSAGPATPGPSGPSVPIGGVATWERGEREDLGSRGRTRDLGGEDRLRAGELIDLADRDVGRAAGVTERVERILTTCLRRPGERPGAMFFRFWGDNPFELSQLDNQSTFAVDVDTASYALARRMLVEGYLPTREQVRTEEFLNYFKPDVPAPEEGDFAIHTDLVASRFGVGIAPRSGRVEAPHLLRVVVRGREVSRLERKPLALTFVVDTSGSMKKNRRLELVKHALRQLTNQLDGRDAIALVAFSNEARLVLPMTSAANRGVIESAIFGLNPDGGTNADAGIRLGFELALNELTLEATNRVVFLSDGVANIGETDQERIAESVKAHREKGIYLNTIGVGLENHNDVFMEQLADKGDGICNYVDSADEVERALVENFTGAFEPIARDVKIQVEFDPRFVHRWRLLGYENRAIADADFRNDAVDAGEVGAGHQVTALYELDLNAIPDGADPSLATVRLRWKQPSGPERDPLEDGATEMEIGVNWNTRTHFEGASVGLRRSVCVAQFAEILRRSIHARNDSLDELISVAATLERELADPDHIEFMTLLMRTRELIRQAPYPVRGDLARCIDTLRRNRILDCEYSDLRVDVGDELVAELERQNRELENRIRDLIRQGVEGR